MFKVNQDYLKLPGSYLFSTVARKQREYQAAHPEAEIIKLSIGDVTQPLAPAIVEALHGAVDEMAHAETFHGYAPDLGYEFLRSAMAKKPWIRCWQTPPVLLPHHGLSSSCRCRNCCSSHSPHSLRNPSVLCLPESVFHAQTIVHNHSSILLLCFQCAFLHKLAIHFYTIVTKQGDS